MCSWGQVATAPVQTQPLTVGDLEQVSFPIYIRKIITLPL